jgi:hypothetical protein
MKNFSVLKFATLLLACIPYFSFAQIIGTPSTYSGLTWNATFSATGVPSACNEVRLDAIADLATGVGIVLAGAVNCYALNGSYVTTGGGYISTTGQLNMALTFGNGYMIVCTNMNAAFSGSCSVISNSGLQVGTAYLQFK